MSDNERKMNASPKSNSMDTGIFTLMVLSICFLALVASITVFLHCTVVGRVIWENMCYAIAS